MPVPKEVHAGPRGRASGQRAFGVDPSFAGSSKRAEIGEAARADLLGETDQEHQHLRRRLGVGQGPVARRRRNTEEVGERREADPAHAPLEQSASEGGGAERRLGQAPIVHERELPFEEALVEARVVRHEERIARERQEAAEHGGDRRRLAQLLVAEPGEAGDGVRQRNSWIDERLERLDRLQRLHANRAELADTVACCGKPGRLEVEDDELGLFEQRVGLRPGQRNRRPSADEPAVACGDLGQERTREAVGDRGGCKEGTGGVRRRQRPALLERFHQPIERIQRQLHL